MADDELKALMSQLIKSQNELLEEFRNNHPKKKDKWDKFSSVSAFTSGVLIAILGLIFTNVYAERQASYNNQQAAYNKQQAEHDNDLKVNQLRLTSIQAVGQFMPYLTGEDQAKREFALLLVGKLTDPALIGQMDVGQLGTIFKGEGSIRALTTVALTGDEREKQTANTGLAEIALSSKGDEKKLATAALERVSAESQSLYTAKPGETIKVEIISEKKPASLSASLDKKQLNIEGNSFTFALSNGKGQTSYLLVTTRGNVGDVYRAQVSGSNATLKHNIRQTDKEATHTFVFKIE
jgi:hypothetical protein